MGMTKGGEKFQGLRQWIRRERFREWKGGGGRQGRKAISWAGAKQVTGVLEAQQADVGH